MQLLGALISQNDIHPTGSHISHWFQCMKKYPSMLGLKSGPPTYTVISSEEHISCFKYQYIILACSCESAFWPAFPKLNGNTFKAFAEYIDYVTLLRWEYDNEEE